jgi:signal transduction histidine kinase
MFERFRQGSIRRQIVTLAVLPVLLVGALGIVTEPIFPEDIELSRTEVFAARIDLLADQLQHAASEDDANAVLKVTRMAGLDVQLDNSIRADEKTDFGFEERLLFILSEIHKRKAWAATQSDGIQRIAIDVAGRQLSIAPPADLSEEIFDDDVVSILLYVLLITVPVMLLSLYAARLIVAPLTGLSAAAVTQRTVGPDGLVFEEVGPRELRHLATRLNEMHRQVHVMLGERTAVLRSVSHDLRTPLTRMKLRVEGSVPADVAGLLLRDINTIDEMIDETLNYLRNENQTEPLKKSDLPSLLKTICTDFSDIGFAVTYSGPARLGFACRPKALSRAISNLVDNATKYGDQVNIALTALPEGGIRLEVIDNGPGIPQDLLEKVIDPFVKVDPARPIGKRIGFGLGLSIVQEIVKRHGGQLKLIPRHPNGFTAEIVLPAAQA